MSKLFRSVFLILLLFAASQAQDYLPELVKRVKPSSVSIETFNTRGETVSRGSGFFIANDRIITNRHVIERSSRVVITLVDGKKFVAKGVLAVDGEGDLALLQVDLPVGEACLIPRLGVIRIQLSRLFKIRKCPRVIVA